MAEDRRPVRFSEILSSLLEGDIAFIVVGGVTAVLEGAPVSTFDLDVVYSLEEENLVRLAGVLDNLAAVCVDPGGRGIRPSAESRPRPQAAEISHVKMTEQSRPLNLLTPPDLLTS